MQPSFEILQIVFSVLVIGFGLTCALIYLRKPRARGGSAAGEKDRDERPWRRIGAAICLLVSVMFVVGVYTEDTPDRPRAYAAFWVVIMALVLWLCGLALKDLRYTQKKIAQWRARKPSFKGASARGRVPAKEPRR